jgi:hypothetical protein
MKPGWVEMSLSSSAHALAEHVERRPLSDSPISIILTERDDSDDRGDQLSQADGQSFIIEYTDSQGGRSVRRVTVWSIVAGSGGAPCLLAFCHERKARRQFRIDRIQSFIDLDGEVFEDVPSFVAENFGISVGIADARAQSNKHWNGVIAAVRNDAVILSAIIRADGKLANGEVDYVTDYLWRLVEKSGDMLSDAEVLALQRYTARLRPTEESILRSLDVIAKRSPTEINKLLSAAVKAMDADGKRHDDEIVLINAIALDLIGTQILR